MDLDDESDDSSSSSSPPETLDQFRVKWQQELTANKESNQKVKSNQNAIDRESPDNSNDQVIFNLHVHL